MPAWRGEKHARELGTDQIWLGVMVKNTQAVAWYKKMGFTVTETTPFVMGSTTVDHYISYLPLPLPTARTQREDSASRWARKVGQVSRLPWRALHDYGTAVYSISSLHFARLFRSKFTTSRSQ